MTKSNYKVLVTGGGTGGHVTPALAIIKYLKDHANSLAPGKNIVFRYIGSKHGVEKRMAEQAAIDFIGIESGKLRRAYNLFGYFTWANLKDVFRVPFGILQAIYQVKRFNPDVILSTGGYVSVPPVVAGWFWRKRIISHEQTVTVGLANRIAAFFATRIALSFEGAVQELPKNLRKKTFITGNPVRPLIFEGDKAKAIEICGFSPEDNHLPAIYVTGGAQGARIINRAIEAELGNLLGICRVIHQCGQQPEGDEQDFDRLSKAVAQLPDHLRRRYCLTRFVGEEIGHFYGLADLVVSRAGAGTVTEVSALGKPAIFIPLEPTGGNEQVRNARRSKEAGAAEIIPQGEMSGASLLNKLERLLGDRAKLREMGSAALRLARPNAARDMAVALLSDE
jgi:UDP-N-acetylglucosamine--N-acetylmuramyl-(pentapeptide) pyrophosphoryl-undecaprenol N-acetylglucosamine transferase